MNDQILTGVSEKKNRSQSIAIALFRRLLALVFIGAIAFTRADSDLWGHVRFGQDLVETRSIARTDSYSFTSDRPWVNHEWLAELAMAVSYRLAGATGLIFLKSSLVLLIVILTISSNQNGSTLGRDALAVFVILGTITSNVLVRPQVFSLAMFTLLIRGCVDADSGRRWLVWALPGLFVFWVNAHGGWLLGGVVYAAWLAGYLVRSKAGRLALLVSGIVTLLGTLINPYGIGMWRFLYETVGINRSDITDWQPVYRVEPAVGLAWVVTTAVCGIVIVRRRRTPVRTRYALPLLILAAASFRVSRITAFYVLGTAILWGPQFVAAVDAFLRPDVSHDSRPAPLFTRIGLALVGAAALLIVSPGLRCIQMDKEWLPEPAAATFIQEHGLEGRLLPYFDWGEYAIWHFPRLKVSIDGRRETVYSAQLHERHLAFYFNEAAPLALPDELGVQYIWLPRKLPVVNRLLEHGWATRFHGPVSVVLGRDASGGRSPGSMAVSSSNVDQYSSRRCFSGP